MAYVEYLWKDGDIITAEKLNEIEEGIGTGDFFIDVIVNDENQTVLNKTYAEIEAIIDKGIIPWFKTQSGTRIEITTIIAAVCEEIPGRYIIMMNNRGQISVESKDSYPIIDDGKPITEK